MAKSFKAAERDSQIEFREKIGGTVFSVGGEALTPAKRATLEAAGGEVYPFYAIVELGPLVACASSTLNRNF